MKNHAGTKYRPIMRGLIMDFYFPSLYKNMNGCFKGTEGLFYSSIGRVYYVYAGKGENILLLHNLGPGMSSYEWCRNFYELSKHFKVFAVDMPGYARSEKNAYVYTAPVFVKFIKEFIMKKIKAPAYIVTSGICANYAAMAAYGLPKLIKGIIMSSPVASVNDYKFFRENAKRELFKDVYGKYTSLDELKNFAEKCVSKSAARNDDGMLDEMYRCMIQKPYSEYAAGSYIGGYSNMDSSYVLNMLSCPVSILPGSKTPDKKFNNFSCTKRGTLSPHIEESNYFNDFVCSKLS